MTANNALKRVSTLLFAIIVAVAMMGFTAMPANADDDPMPVIQDGFEFLVYFDGGTTPTSVFVTKYTGTETIVKLPSHFLYKGAKYPVEALGDEAFKGNTIVKKVLIPSGYQMIGVDAFVGCANLEEVVISKTVQSIGINAFLGCGKLKTYKLDCRSISYDVLENDPGIGQNDSYDILAGVKAYVVKDSKIDEFLKEKNRLSREKGGNEIEIIYSADPAAEADLDITPDPVDPPVDKTKQKGTDGTYYGAGASKEAVNKALTALKGEKDQKGMTFGKLRLKMKKVAKTSITLGWSKPSGTKQIVIYGNKCGTATKYIKLATVTGTSYKVAKVSGKKVKKGTFYKFVIVALDKNGNVVSTSKTIHVATTGGKVTNHKALTVKAKVSGKYKAVSKLSVKKGKKKTLKVKGVKASKKLKTKKHVPVRYESANTKIAKVSSKGVITGVKKGKCKVYAFAQSGACKAITVIVK